MGLRSHTMSLGGVFMMLSCFVMRVFCHVDVLWNRYFDSVNTKQFMNHWTLSSAHPFGRKAYQENPPPCRNSHTGQSWAKIRRSRRIASASGRRGDDVLERDFLGFIGGKVIYRPLRDLLLAVPLELAITKGSEETPDVNLAWCLRLCQRHRATRGRTESPGFLRSPESIKPL